MLTSGKKTNPPPPLLPTGGIPSTPATYTTAVGTRLVFRFSDYHNLWLLPSRAAYDSSRRAARWVQTRAPSDGAHAASSRV